MSTTTTIAAFTSESISSNTCYKVVLMPVSDMELRKINIQVFSSVVGKWNIYQVSHPKPRGYFFDFDFESLIVVNGQIYWMDGKDILSYDLNNNNSIQTGGQQCRLMNFPVLSGNYNDESDIFCLKEYRGLLCFLAISKTSRYLSVWVFEEDWNIVHKDIVLLDFVAGMYRRYNMEEYEAFEEVDSESESNYCDKENGAIEEVEVIGFSPVDANVILFGCNDGVWAYDIESTKSEELIEPSFMATTNLVGTRYRVYNSFAIKTMPTVLPSPSWKSIPVIMDQQGHRQSSAVGMVASASQMSYGAAQSPANK
ncbi:hypothetical protein C5167_022865 [Papaver somniferum]|uniref:F-box associated domain-containing protein n=1 Tax=Papaver somniferum TaxID=3469 RepID=A0A4Y7JM58_PAPSO|nr:uncharacterized protein LOC113281937 isoform X1 [Papaver somniferum]RZC61102.1 hypothetical protein C5167_022865 [Papaver somniferum]